MDRNGIELLWVKDLFLVLYPQDLRTPKLERALNLSALSVLTAPII